TSEPAAVADRAAPGRSRRIPGQRVKLLPRVREYGQGHRRGRAHPPRSVSRPQAWVAHAPLQVWSWDITFLPTTVRGQFYRLYLVLDVYSRMIVGWEVHVDERAEHAATLITQAC